MRARVVGDAISVDLIHKVDDAMKVVRSALKAGLPDVGISAGGADGSYRIDIRLPQGAFAAEPVAAMLAVIAEIQNTTPEALIDGWRDKAGELATTLSG